MAFRDPAAAKGVQVVAHFPRQRVDAVVERIDWHKVDARATSEEALEDVLVSFVDTFDGKRWTGPIAEESLTLRNGSPFRTKDYERALSATRKKTETKRLVELVEQGQTYAADEEPLCTKKSKSKKRPRIVPKVISYSSDACYKGWWLQEEIDSNDYLFWGSGDHATPADVPRGKWRKYDQLRRGVRVVAGPGAGCTLRVNDEPPVVFERTSEMHHGRPVYRVVDDGAPPKRARPQQVAVPAARPPPAPCPRKGKVIEIRRVGGASWQRFGSQTAAAKAFGLTQAEVSYLVNDRSKASARALEFEARRVAAGPVPAPAPVAAPAPAALPPVAAPPVAAPPAPSPPSPLPAADDDDDELRFEEADDDDARSVNVIDMTISDDEGKAPASEPMAEEERPMGPGPRADPAALEAVDEVLRAVETLPPGREYLFGLKAMGGVEVSADTKKYPVVARELTKFLKEHGTAGPGTKWCTCVWVSSDDSGRAQNYHLDENNCGLTSTIALGNYTGGNLVVGVGRDAVTVNTRAFARGDGCALYVFDACGEWHRVTPWEGDRWVVSFYRVRPCFLRHLKEEDRAELLRLGFPLPPSDGEIDEAKRDFIEKHRAGDRAAREAMEKREAAKALLAEAAALDARAEADRAA